MATALKLNGLQKAAILMISMGKDAAARVFQHLNDEEIEQLTLAMAGISKVDSKEKDEVLSEFQELCIAQDYLAVGGITYAQDVLESAVGKERAQEIILKLTSQLRRSHSFSTMTVLSLMAKERSLLTVLLLS